MHPRVQIGPFHRGRELDVRIRGDRVPAFGTVERDSRDPAGHLVGQGVIASFGFCVFSVGEHRTRSLGEALPPRSRAGPGMILVIGQRIPQFVFGVARLHVRGGADAVRQGGEHGTTIASQPTDRSAIAG